MSSRYKHCPQCNTCHTISIQTIVEEFPYGVDGPDQVTLEAMIPQFSCDACGFEFTDYEAEKTREAAVQEYLASKIV